MNNLTGQARSYFNFLLNRDLREPIVPSAAPAADAVSVTALEQLWSQALGKRPELPRLEGLQKASEEQVRIARRQKWPTLSLGLDGGTHGEDYRFGEGYNFATASLIFTWKIFRWRRRFRASAPGTRRAAIIDTATRTDRPRASARKCSTPTIAWRPREIRSPQPQPAPRPRAPPFTSPVASATRASSTRWSSSMRAAP